MLVGYADEVYVDPTRGLTVVRDVKVSKNLASQSAADDMMDSQLHLYAWGLKPMVEEGGVRPITAIGFDRARMIPPVPPKLTQSGRLATYQGQPSVSGCDLDTYLSTGHGMQGVTLAPGACSTPTGGPPASTGRSSTSSWSARAVRRWDSGLGRTSAGRTPGSGAIPRCARREA